LKTLLLVLFATIFTISVFAQSTANSSATVTASLVKGLSMSQIGGNIDFGSIFLTGAAQNPSILPNNGTSFRVIGHPSKNVTVTFANVNLTNDAWATLNSGTSSSLLFTPSVTQTGSSSSYTGSSAVTSGNVIPLVNVNGDGNMYVWVGGSLAIASNQAQGDYTGTFTLSVAY
jgi:Mat/Ecp fimbriae major subunit